MLDTKLNSILVLLDSIYASHVAARNDIMALKDTVTQLAADVAAQTTVVQSVQALLSGLALEIKALADQAIDPQTQASLVGILQTLDANTAELAAAVAATPTPPAAAAAVAVLDANTAELAAAPPAPAATFTPLTG